MGKHSVELLAPAGNTACALAAFDAGADAVYAGLGRFNARERGENFTLEQFQGLVEYAHRHNKKVYLTLNTLVKERELEAVAQEISELYRALPDAVLVQDIGLARMLRECFPELELHASTQMGFHNSSGLALAANMGFKRVVLERQLTLDEIKQIAPSSPVELEVFIHGALCCSLSGECLFSSWSGGHSGNRGKCKQPCRRRFFSKSGNGFFFSTADLAALELIPELKNMNVASFKIEGRLRQPDYVHSTVSAYRRLLDAEKVDKQLMGEVRKELAAGLGRKWSHGFYSADSMKSLIQYKSLGSSGMPCGRVEEVGEAGFAFSASRRVHLGDRVRLQPENGDEGPAMTITKMFVGNRAVTVAQRGDYCYVPCDKPVEYKALVYKVGQAQSLPKAKEFPTVKQKLNMQIALTAAGFSGRVLNTVPVIEFFDAFTPAKAEKRALTEEQLKEEFAWRGDPVYASGVINATVGEGLFMPLSELKKLKNRFYAAVSEQLDAVRVLDPGAEALTAFHSLYLTMPRGASERVLRETVAVTAHSAMPGNPKARRSSSIFSYNKKSEEVILPDFCPPGKEAALKKLIDEAVQSGIRRFRITSLYAIELMKKYPECELVSSTPLPVCNALAAVELSRFGVNQVQAHVELEKTALEELVAASPVTVELYRFGRVPLLSTRAQVAADGDIKDSRDGKYQIVYDPLVKLTRLFSTRVLSIPRLLGTADFYDLTHAHWGAKDTGEFNFNTDLA